MRTRGAVVMNVPGEYEVLELELDAPRQDEVLVRMVATGLCHSDDHFARGDMIAGTFPWLGGHEGAGVVEEVGPNTSGFQAGDHVVFSFLPSCGQCRWCSSGLQNLCDFGATLLVGSRFDDTSSFRVHTLGGQPVGQMCGLGTFSEYTVVSTQSAIKIDKDIPLESACLLGCGVGTGWGSAVYSADVRPGDVVIVMGVGGIGINAVQGARHAGAAHIIAVDPVEMKRDKAIEFGATTAFGHISDASDYAKTLTNGQGADSAIVAVGVTTGEHIGEAFTSIRKAGTLVVTGVGQMEAVGIPISPVELAMYQKRIQGTHFGACNPRRDIPRQIQLYRDGILKLDELVTRTYRLDDIAAAYKELLDGQILRGVVTF